MHINRLMLPIATQIIGESLPISSSGHMMLVCALLERFGLASLLAMPDFFDHFLHGPTLIIIALYFYDAWWPLLRMLVHVLYAWFRTGCSYVALRYSYKRVLLMFVHIAGLVIAADGVTVCCYVATRYLAKNVSCMDGLPMLVIGLSVTCLVLLSSRRRQQSARAHINLATALILGLVQGIALLPGLSRFACTVIIAQWLGISPRRALQFSFLMFVPLIVGAFFINGLPVMLMDPAARIFLQPVWLLGYAGATVLAYELFAWACSMTLKNQLWYFGLYMILPIVCVIALLTW